MGAGLRFGAFSFRKQDLLTGIYFAGAGIT